MIRKNKNIFMLQSLILSAVWMFQFYKDPFTEDYLDDGQSYEISGRLFQDCSMQPIANKPIDLFQELEQNWDKSIDGGVLATTTTDANGNFKFVLKSIRPTNASFFRK